MSRGYQYGFSSAHASMYSDAGRGRKAQTLVAVLSDVMGERLHSARVLNVGCSTGIMDAHVAPHVGVLTGVDIDEAAIDYARRTHVLPNLRFVVGDAMQLAFDAASVDVVICSQVYEHAPDADRLMAEVRRVLVPGGVCYFAATNRLCVIEQHYRLPLLSIVPVWVAHWYLRAAGRGRYYYERHRTYWGLRRLVRQFELIDFTRRVLDEPAFFHTDYLFGATWKRHAARLLSRIAYWSFPGYLWVLRRPPDDAGRAESRRNRP